jgi:hypothetical protein
LNFIIINTTLTLRWIRKDSLTSTTREVLDLRPADTSQEEVELRCTRDQGASEGLKNLLITSSQEESSQGGTLKRELATTNLRGESSILRRRLERSREFLREASETVRSTWRDSNLVSRRSKIPRRSSLLRVKTLKGEFRMGISDHPRRLSLEKSLRDLRMRSL